jgi:hypothetical protein
MTPVEAGWARRLLSGAKCPYTHAMPDPFPSITAALARNDPDELLHIPIALSLNPPEDEQPGYAEVVCLQLAAHPHANVRGNAILGFGHLARTAGVIRDVETVRALVLAGLADPDPYVSGQADSAASDLEFFLGWTLERD